MAAHMLSTSPGHLNKQLTIQRLQLRRSLSDCVQPNGQSFVRVDDPRGSSALGCLGSRHGGDWGILLNVKNCDNDLSSWRGPNEGSLFKLDGTNLWACCVGRPCDWNQHPPSGISSVSPDCPDWTLWSSALGDVLVWSCKREVSKVKQSGGWWSLAGKTQGPDYIHPVVTYSYP